MDNSIRIGLAALVTACVALVGCGSDDTTSDAATTVTSTTIASDSNPSTTTADGTPATKVNANTASKDELAAAFQAAGIANASRWAGEVEEYRPYTDDGWAHLRQELSKYNIDQATFDQIIGVLEL